MKFSELGLDRWLADKASELCGSDLSVARVTAVDRGRYLIRGEDGEVPAELTGKFLHLAESSAELPCVGDWVCVHYRDAGAQASIHHLLPRRSFLRRKAAGRDVEFQMIAAIRIPRPVLYRSAQEGPGIWPVCPLLQEATGRAGPGLGRHVETAGCRPI